MAGIPGQFADQLLRALKRMRLASTLALAEHLGCRTRNVRLGLNRLEKKGLVRIVGVVRDSGRRGAPPLVWSLAEQDAEP